LQFVRKNRRLEKKTVHQRIKLKLGFVTCAFFHQVLYHLLERGCLQGEEEPELIVLLLLLVVRGWGSIILPAPLTRRGAVSTTSRAVPAPPTATKGAVTLPIDRLVGHTASIAEAMVRPTASHVPLVEVIAVITTPGLPRLARVVVVVPAAPAPIAVGVACVTPVVLGHDLARAAVPRATILLDRRPHRAASWPGPLLVLPPLMIR
jgi:hypothetical protein